MPTQLWTAIHQGVLADRPVASSALKGYVFFASDVHGGTLYQCDGSAWVQIAAALDGSSYALPVATTTTRGGIKPGRGLVVTADGTLLPHDLSAEQIASVAASTLGGAHTLPDAVLSGNVPLLVGGLLPATELPLATTGAVGAVKVGRGLVISSDGTLRPQDVAADQIASVAAGSVAGTLAQNRGGTGLDTSGITDGQVLIGQSSDHSFGRAALTAGSGITITNGGHSISIAASGGGGSGTVTSVDVAAPSPLSSSGGPLSSSGTITLSWASGQTANRVLASPDGTTGSVSLRALVAGDLPSLPASQITSGQLAAARGGTAQDGSSAANGTLLIGNGSGYTLATLTAGSGVTVTNGAGTVTIAASGGSGTVTSVALSVPGFLSVSGSPVTASGTLAVTLATQTANTIFGGPSSGSAAAPTFRSMVDADLPPALAAGAKLTAAATCT